MSQSTSVDATINGSPQFSSLRDGLVLFVTALAVGQVIFKRVGLAVRGRPLVDSVLYLLGSRPFDIVLTIYALATFLWSRVPLSQAYPWVAWHGDCPSVGKVYVRRALEPLFWLGIMLTRIRRMKPRF